MDKKELREYLVSTRHFTPSTSPSTSPPNQNGWNMLSSKPIQISGRESPQLFDEPNFVGSAGFSSAFQQDQLTNTKKINLSFDFSK